MWGPIRYCRTTGADDDLVAVLDRAIHGDVPVGFLDHDEVYDGFEDPPRLLTPEAVTEIARALGPVDLDAVLAGLPAAPPAAAAACGFDRGFRGVRTALPHRSLPILAPVPRRGRPARLVRGGVGRLTGRADASTTPAGPRRGR
ncbi:hypothetical protein ACIBBD_06010 [Streptomyces sp. NPDC051315]|uniref:hypothetical protein n=1 Tax=Streptomyces sp. NPDC051315 TaxID=3365650 RepID=UPI00379D6280